MKNEDLRKQLSIQGSIEGVWEAPELGEPFYFCDRLMQITGIRSNYSLSYNRTDFEITLQEPKEWFVVPNELNEILGNKETSEQHAARCKNTAENLEWVIPQTVGLCCDKSLNNGMVWIEGKGKETNVEEMKSHIEDYGKAIGEMQPHILSIRQ